MAQTSRKVRQRSLLRLCFRKASKVWLTRIQVRGEPREQLCVLQCEPKSAVLLMVLRRKLHTLPMTFRAHGISLKLNTLRFGESLDDSPFAIQKLSADCSSFATAADSLPVND